MEANVVKPAAKKKMEGVTVRRLAGGGTISTFPDGITVESRPDGTKITTWPPKDGRGEPVRKETRPDGTKITRRADGTTTTVTPDRTKTVLWPDGAQRETKPDGTKLERMSDGATQEIKKNGDTVLKLPSGATIEKRGADGMQTAVLPDGSKVETHPDGTKVSIHKDGTKVESKKDGTKTTVWADGRTKQTKPDGRTITTRPLKKPPDASVAEAKKAAEDVMAALPKKVMAGITSSNASAILELSPVARAQSPNDAPLLPDKPSSPVRQFMQREMKATAPIPLPQGVAKVELESPSFRWGKLPLQLRGMHKSQVHEVMESLVLLEEAGLDSVASAAEVRADAEAAGCIHATEEQASRYRTAYGEQCAWATSLSSWRWHTRDVQPGNNCRLWGKSPYEQQKMRMRAEESQQEVQELAKSLPPNVAKKFARAQANFENRLGRLRAAAEAEAKEPKPKKARRDPQKDLECFQRFGASQEQAAVELNSLAASDYKAHSVGEGCAAIFDKATGSWPAQPARRAAKAGTPATDGRKGRAMLAPPAWGVLEKDQQASWTFEGIELDKLALPGKPKAEGNDAIQKFAEATAKLDAARGRLEAAKKKQRPQDDELSEEDEVEDAQMQLADARDACLQTEGGQAIVVHSDLKEALMQAAQQERAEAEGILKQKQESAAELTEAEQELHRQLRIQSNEPEKFVEADLALAKERVSRAEAQRTLLSKDFSGARERLEQAELRAISCMDTFLAAGTSAGSLGPLAEQVDKQLKEDVQYECPGHSTVEYLQMELGRTLLQVQGWNDRVSKLLSEFKEASEEAAKPGKKDGARRSRKRSALPWQLLGGTAPVEHPKATDEDWKPQQWGGNYEALWVDVDTSTLTTNATRRFELSQQLAADLIEKTVVEQKVVGLRDRLQLARQLLEGQPTQAKEETNGQMSAKEREGRRLRQPRGKKFFFFHTDKDIFGKRPVVNWPKKYPVRSKASKEVAPLRPAGTQAFVSLHLGGWGRCVGIEAWRQLCGEHGLGPQGRPEGGDSEGLLAGANVCFAESATGRYVPRAVLAGAVTVDDARRTGLFAPVDLVEGGQDSSSFSALSSSEGALCNSILEAVRMQMEQADRVHCLLLTHALFDYSTSGLAYGLLPALAEDYSRITRWSLALAPHPTPVGEDIKSTFLSLYRLRHCCTLGTLVDYGATSRLATSRVRGLGIPQADVDAQLQAHPGLVSQVVADVTAPMRTGNRVNASDGWSELLLGKAVSNLVPYPRLNVTYAAIGPLAARVDSDFIVKPKNGVAVLNCLQHGQLLSGEMWRGKYLGDALWCRGMTRGEVTQGLETYRRDHNRYQVVDYNPVGLSVGCLRDGRTPGHQLTALRNSLELGTSITEPWRVDLDRELTTNTDMFPVGELVEARQDAQTFCDEAQQCSLATAQEEYE